MKYNKSKERSQLAIVVFSEKQKLIATLCKRKKTPILTLTPTQKTKNHKTGMNI